LTKNRNASIYRLTLRQAVGPTAVESADSAHDEVT
jgi:hypothetical protein